MDTDTFQQAYPDLEVSLGQSMRTSDGTQLIADVYTPKQSGEFPVLLMRQPYGRDIASTVVYAQPSWFARQGYIVAIQDVRGRGGSEGTFYTFRNESEDGYEAVEWAAALPKSNGRVGMYGFSYQGATQLLAALKKPPALQAIAPHMTAFDLYSGWFYRSGLLCLANTLGWGNQMLREDAQRAGCEDTYFALEDSCRNNIGLCHSFPVNRCQPLTTDNSLPSYVSDWLAHSKKDNYWKEFDLLESSAQLDIPIFHLAGWHDYFLRGSMDGYDAMKEHSPGKQFLVVGPWSHIPWGDKLAGVSLRESARIDTDALLLRWFDRWLKDDASAAPDTTGVRYFVMGSNEWKNAPSWPPPEVVHTNYFLTSQDRANSRFGNGAMDTVEPKKNSWDCYNYDHEVTVTAPGFNGGMLQYGPFDLSFSQQDNNILVYSTTPFRKPVFFAGKPVLRLFVQSSAPDTAFIARLSIVATKGLARFLCLGAAMLRDAETGDDGVKCLEIKIDDLACQLDAGESLRLDIASSAFPLLIRHPNSLSDPASIASPAEYKRATQVIYHGPSHPSCLRIPAHGL